MCIRDSKDLIMAVNTNISWPPDSNDLTFENALKVLPTELLSFLKVMLGFSNQTQITEHISVPEAEEKKVVSIAQDLIHVATSGRTLTHKAISLGVTVRQITGSQRVTQVLNQFDHCCSPDVLYKHDSVLTESISTDEVFIPRNISENIPTTVVWDNNDFSEETLSGKGTTHVANGIIIQNSDISEPVPIREKVEVTRKAAAAIQPPQVVIKPFILKKTKPIACPILPTILIPRILILMKVMLRWNSVTAKASTVTVTLMNQISFLNGRHLLYILCLLYTSPSPRDATLSRMPSSA